MPILYTFLPESDGWTGTETFSASGRYSEITDSFDYHSVSTLTPPPAVIRLNTCAAFKQADNMGTIVRFKGSFSLSALPVFDIYGNGGSVAIIGLAYDDDPPNGNWFLWYFLEFVFVSNTGKIGFNPIHAHDMSTNTISAGVTYDLEVVFNVGTGERQIYVDGDLWLDKAYSTDPNSSLTYVQFVEGLEVSETPLASGYLSPGNVTLHIGAYTDGDHVWTLEDTPGGGRWTMMAVL